MRSASLGLAVICALFANSPGAAEGLVKQGAAAAGGTAGAIGGSAVGGPIGGAVGGVVGGAIGKGTVGVIGAIIPGGGKKKKLRKAQAEAEAQSRAEAQPQTEASSPVIAVQAPAASGESADAASLAPDNAAAP